MTALSAEFEARGADLRICLSVLRRGRRDPTMRFDETGFWRATHTCAGPATIRLEQRMETIEAQAWGPGASEALEGVPALIGVDDDPSVFDPDHPLLKDAHRRAPGLRLGRTHAVFEAILPSILEQKITSADAHRSYRALIKAYGEPAPGPVDLMLAPTPEVLGALAYFAYHPFGIERRRAETIIRVAREAERLERVTIVAAFATLTGYQGIGPWTAAEVMRVALGDPDAVSVGDYHLPRTIAYALAGETSADDARMLQLLEPFAGQRARAIRLIEMYAPRLPRRGPRMPLRAIAKM